MVPATRILAAEPDVREATVLAVEARRMGFDWGVVHQIPKLAMDLYIYFAGLVNDKVGVTYYQITAERQRVREHNRRRLGGKLAFQGIYRYLPFARGIYSDEGLKLGILMG